MLVAPDDVAVDCALCCVGTTKADCVDGRGVAVGCCVAVAVRAGRDVGVRVGWVAVGCVVTVAVAVGAGRVAVAVGVCCGMRGIADFSA